LLAQGQWFSPASSTTKTGRHDIAEILLKVELNTKIQIQIRLGIISLAYAAVHVTDFPVVNVHVDELSCAQIWHHKLCVTYPVNVNINNRLPIKAYYRICTFRLIRIEIIHGSQNVL